MKELTFERPSVRKVLERSGISPVPQKINDKSFWRVINSGLVLTVGESYQQAVETIEFMKDNPEYIALFPSKFGVSRERYEQGLKSLDLLVKIDSQRVLAKISGVNRAPERLTKEFLEEFKIKPERLSALAFEDVVVEDPKIGGYWAGTDGHFHAWTFYRSTVAAEMEAMKKQGDFPKAIIEDPTTYGKNVRLRVPSKSEKDRWYEMTLTRLPMAKRNSSEEFSGWLNISHNSNDPDAVYVGSEHDKRVLPVSFWSSSANYGFYEAMIFAEQKGRQKFRANPFPIPKDKSMTDFIDSLRLRSLIIEEDPKTKELKLNVLNKTEMDLVIGARTVSRGYDLCWTHWGDSNREYLYTKSN